MDRSVIAALPDPKTLQLVPLSPIPVAIISGFLGSGKTTLIRRLLASPGLTDTAVILNEFGEIGLDHALIEAGNEDTLLLGGGCLCCTYTADLPNRLRSLLDRREQGSLPPYRRVVVETSGLADPVPVLQSFMTDPLRLSRYRVSGLTTVVDGQLGAATLARHEEARRQVAAADRIIISKMDIISEDRSAATAIRNYSTAPVLTALSENALPNLLFDAWQKSLKVAMDTQWQNGHDYVSSARSLNRDLALKDVECWLEQLIGDFGDRLLRVKALLPIAGENRPVVLHTVQHAVYPLEFLKTWPMQRRQGVIVMIAQHLSQYELSEALDRLAVGD